MGYTLKKIKGKNMKNKLNTLNIFNEAFSMLHTEHCSKFEEHVLEDEFMEHVFILAHENNVEFKDIELEAKEYFINNMCVL